MNVDWSVVVRVATPLVTLVLGAVLHRWLERRPKVISYLGHVASFHVTSTAQPFLVFTHAIVVRNSGKKIARNVRV